MARLFEGMVLPALGVQGRVENDDKPFAIGDFRVVPKQPNLTFLADKNLPQDAGHIFAEQTAFLSDPSSYLFKLTSFFDWNELANREFTYLDVVVQRLDGRAELVGHRALLEVSSCTIWAHDEAVRPPG